MIISLLKRISSSLEENNISYMLWGSIALNTYSVPGMTMDINLVIELDTDNLSNFFQFLTIIGTLTKIR